MLVHNLPCPVDASLYEEAVAEYLANAKNFIISCYLVGNTNFPGLSDLDLVVIPQDRLLAPLRLAIKRALPPKYHCIVLHDPFILPRSHLSVYRYTSLGKGKLVYGPPLLADISLDSSPYSARLCTELENLYRQYHFLCYCRSRPSLNARLWIAIGSSLRFAMRDLAACHLLPIREYENYKDTYDQMRAYYLESPSELRFWQMFDYYESKLKEVLDKVASALDVDLRRADSLPEFYSRKSYLLTELSHEEAQEREVAIRDYLCALRSRHFGYGSLFESSWRDPLLHTSFMPFTQYARQAKRWLQGIMANTPLKRLWAICLALMEAQTS